MRKTGFIPIGRRGAVTGRVAVLALAFLAALAISGSNGAGAAEGGQSPWLKGYRDTFTGVVPPEAGFYLRNDVVYYGGDVNRTVLNGVVRAGVEMNVVAELLSLTYVSSATLLGGTLAVGAAPTLVYADVDVSASIGPVGLSRSDSEFNIGDFVVTPAMLGWHAGNFHWNAALGVIVPVGKYETSDLANTGKNYWAVLPQVGITYFDPETGWDVSAAAIYAISWENEATNYENGDVLHFEGAVTKGWDAWRMGAVGYAMVQVTGDSGSGAALGAHKSEVFGVGPLVSYTFGVGETPVTVLAKWYHEFGAKNTTEGDTVTAAFSFKF